MGRDSDERISRLRLVDAGRPELRWGTLLIVPSPENRPPFPVDALAREEDTYLVLSADSELRPAAEHPIRLMTALHDAVPEPPGSVVVRPGSPLRLLAVVHDLGREPSWREEWVGQALTGVLRECEARGLASLGLPLLGCVHGHLAVERSVELLRQTVRQIAPTILRRVWLMVSSEKAETLRGRWL